MEKINVAELLKDCPSGMELDCSMYENCTFEAVFEYCLYPIQIKTPVGLITLNKYGSISKNAHSKCIIFPKGKTTWEGFVPPCKFKDGDIVVAVGNESVQIFLLKQFICSKNANNHVGDCFFGWDFQRNELFEKGYWSFNRLATEEEKEKLFKAIKDNGYRWDEETKTLKKLPTFKVGDSVKSKINQYIYTITDIAEDVYIMHYATDYVTDKFGYHVPFCNEDNYELVSNKFDITTLKPFESRVLVRNVDGDLWKPALYGFSPSKGGCYVVGGTYWKQCIPYEANKELLGTTNNPKEHGSN